MSTKLTPVIQADGSQWVVNLDVVPHRVVAGRKVQLTVNLIPPPSVGEGNFDKLTKEQKQSFTYKWKSPYYPIQGLPLDTTGGTPDNPYVVNDWGRTIWIDIPRDIAAPLPGDPYTIEVEVTSDKSGELKFGDKKTAQGTYTVVQDQVQAAVTLQRTASGETRDKALWVAIRNRTGALDFERYQRFIESLFCSTEDPRRLLPDDPVTTSLMGKRTGFSASIDKFNIYGPYAYSVLKLATQVFIILECGVKIDERSRDGAILFDLEKERIRLHEPSVSLKDISDRLRDYLVQYQGNHSALPYLERIVSNLININPNSIEEVLPYCYGILQHRFSSPSLLELIWSYWHEEGMLVQTMNAIALRFQNIRRSMQDPLGELEIDPLRPLNNMLWGYIQDEHNRLTVPRRAHEYEHHYGLTLVGKAVSRLVSADSRSKFIEAFHNLLYRAAIFYREDADTTVIADAFPLLNALKEVHLLLAEGAHNQFGDLPHQARAEMLMMQWLLARPEMREFLRGRYMVPYQEGWMGAVDSMKKLQGWTDTTVTHFHELAVTGERIILSIRYGDWIDIEDIEDQAKNWARYWKPEIQRYIHGYQTATGVDLAVDITDTREAAIRFQQPSVLLQRRLTEQTSKMAIPRLVSAPASQIPSFAELPLPRRGRMLGYQKDQ